MDRNTILKSIFCAAVLTLPVSCSQDEPFSSGEDAAGDALPEGMYPLQIGSISVSAEESGQPWGADAPQSRVSENSEGSGSLFTNGDVIGVSLGDNTTTYTYDGSTWTSTDPLYWEDTQSATVTAWYPAADEIDFTQQDQGLPYLLKATTDNADYKNGVDLTFTHQLAKVRVVLTGSKANEVADVKIRSYPNAPISQGTLSKSNGSPAYYPMCKATYGSTTCWEANMIPGTLIANNSFQISKSGGTPMNVTLNSNVPITAGYMHTITITVEGPSVEELKTTFYNAFFNNGNTSSPKGTLSVSTYILYATGTTIQKLINDILKTSINPLESKTITAPWGDSIYLEYIGTLHMRITVGSIKFFVYIDNMQDMGYPELTL